jgi:ubiquinone biosynthesis protein UbiJ
MTAPAVASLAAEVEQLRAEVAELTARLHDVVRLVTIVNGAPALHVVKDR